MDASLDRIAVSAGTLLFGEGDVGSCAYLINSGRLEIFLGREGHDVVLATRGRGEIVGEMAIIDNRPRSASVRVIEDCELLVVTAEQIAHRVAETDPNSAHVPRGCARALSRDPGDARRHRGGARLAGRRLGVA